MIPTPPLSFLYVDTRGFIRWDLTYDELMEMSYLEKREWFEVLKAINKINHGL